MPMGAVLISDRLVQMLGRPEAEIGMFANGFTYSGHPVAAAAALKNIEIMEREGIMEHVRDIGPYFQQRLRELEDIPLVGEVRGEGLMACVECVVDRETKEPMMLDYEIGKRIDAHCQENGLLVRPLINMCVMSPPLIITRPQIDEMIGILRRGVEQTMEDLHREGLWKG
jgi:adenosylmethionine-8-amino-7-oxononanoate aminotransferase